MTINDYDDDVLPELDEDEDLIPVYFDTSPGSEAMLVSNGELSALQADGLVYESEESGLMRFHHHATQAAIDETLANCAD